MDLDETRHHCSKENPSRPNQSGFLGSSQHQQPRPNDVHTFFPNQTPRYNTPTHAEDAIQLALSFLQQHAPYLLGMVIAQVAIATAGHWATKERGWDDTWIGACGLAIVFGGPTAALWLAGLDARVPLAMFLQGVIVVGVVKYTEWARQRMAVDLALFVLQTLACLLPPGLLAAWLVLVPPSWVGLLESLVFIGVSVGVVGLTALTWDWHRGQE